MPGATSPTSVLRWLAQFALLGSPATQARALWCVGVEAGVRDFLHFVMLHERLVATICALRMAVAHRYTFSPRICMTGVLSCCCVFDAGAVPCGALQPNNWRQ
jgi:hypothetical protein